MELLERFSEALRGMPIADKDTVVVAVSGGPDSLAMLHLFSRIAARRTLRLVVVHVNHGIRGDDAQADTGFVRRIAAEWDIDCHVEHCDAPALAQAQRWSLETAARRARYSALVEVAKREKARVIAVGHHQDDQAETIMMHVLRGSGVAGLRGMQAASPLSASHVTDPDMDTDGLILIRPLLGISRAEIETYCQAQGLEARIDHSNMDTTLRRNRIRHEVMPLLREINPQVSSALSRLSEIVAADYDFLNAHIDVQWQRLAEQTQAGITFPRDGWADLPLAVQRGLMRRAALSRLPPDKPLDFEQIEAALTLLSDAKVGQQVTLPGGVRVEVGYDAILVTGEGMEEVAPDWPLLASDSAITISEPGVTTLVDNGWAFEITPYHGLGQGSEWQAILADPWRAVLGSRVRFPLILRTRQPGDRFYPQGAGGSQKLSDFQINAQIPAQWRDRVPLLLSDGEIAWLCGWRVDERYAVSPEDEDVWIASFRKMA